MYGCRRDDCARKCERHSIRIQNKTNCCCLSVNMRKKCGGFLLMPGTRSRRPRVSECRAGSYKVASGSFLKLLGRGVKKLARSSFSSTMVQGPHCKAKCQILLNTQQGEIIQDHGGSSTTSITGRKCHCMFQKSADRRRARRKRKSQRFACCGAPLLGGVPRRKNGKLSGTAFTHSTRAFLRTAVEVTISKVAVVALPTTEDGRQVTSMTKLFAQVWSNLVDTLYSSCRRQQKRH